MTDPQTPEEAEETIARWMLEAERRGLVLPGESQIPVDKSLSPG